jgi:hypothetical protein
MNKDGRHGSAMFSPNGKNNPNSRYDNVGILYKFHTSERLLDYVTVDFYNITRGQNSLIPIIGLNPATASDKE